MDARQWLDDVYGFLYHYNEENRFFKKFIRSWKKENFAFEYAHLDYQGGMDDNLLDRLQSFMGRYEVMNSMYLLFKNPKYKGMVSIEKKVQNISSEISSLRYQYNIYIVRFNVPSVDYVQFEWNDHDKEIDIKRNDGTCIGTASEGSKRQYSNLLMACETSVFLEILKDYHNTTPNLNYIYIISSRPCYFDMTFNYDNKEGAEIDHSDHIKQHGVDVENIYTDIFKIKADMIIETKDVYNVSCNLTIAVTYRKLRYDNDYSKLTNSYIKETVDKMIQEYNEEKKGYLYDLVRNTAIDLINVRFQKGMCMIHE